MRDPTDERQNPSDAGALIEEARRLGRRRRRRYAIAGALVLTLAAPLLLAQGHRHRQTAVGHAVSPIAAHGCARGPVTLTLSLPRAVPSVARRLGRAAPAFVLTTAPSGITVRGAGAPCAGRKAHRWTTIALSRPSGAVASVVYGTSVAIAASSG
ncbi:MAG: hypothetical protein ACJ76I_01650 [Gaiellaceae bacterium]